MLMRGLRHSNMSRSAGAMPSSRPTWHNEVKVEGVEADGQLPLERRRDPHGMPMAGASECVSM